MGQLHHTYDEATCDAPEEFISTWGIKQPGNSESTASDIGAPQEGTNVLTEANARSVPHFHALMYIQADYFQIEGLKTRANRYFRESFLYELTQSSYEAMITDIYNSTLPSDQGLRRVSVALTVENLGTFRAKAILDDELLKQMPAFAADLCIAMLHSDTAGSMRNLHGFGRWD